MCVKDDHLEPIPHVLPVAPPLLPARERVVEALCPVLDLLYEPLDQVLLLGRTDGMLQPEPLHASSYHRASSVSMGFLPYLLPHRRPEAFLLEPRTLRSLCLLCTLLEAAGLGRFQSLRVRRTVPFFLLDCSMIASTAFSASTILRDS